MVLGPDPLHRHVAYEEPHIPLFAAPAFQNVSRRGHYGDAVQQMDSSVGTCAVLHVLQSAVAFWGVHRIVCASGQIIAKLKSTGLDTNT
jgi:hypothetical protein